MFPTGFGKTPTKLDGIPENYVSKVDYMVHLVKELEIPKGKLVLVFPSMSGNYGLPYVLTEPEMCAGVIPISPAASGIVPPSKVRALQVFLRRNQRNQRNQALNNFNVTVLQ